MELRVEAVIASSSLVGLCTFLLYVCIVRNKSNASALALVSPSSVFIIGILGRFALGSLVISLTPRAMVLAGEYRQYIVTWNYSGNVAYLWIVYTMVVAFSFALFEWLKTGWHDSRRVADSRYKRGWFKWVKDLRSGKEYGSREIKLAAGGCLGIFFVGSCISAVTGSMDRGKEYEYFASMAFRPEAAFIAFTRLKQIGYFLLPAAWRNCSRLLKVILGVCAVSPLVLEVLGGGRGAILYPLVMIFLGYMCVSLKQTKILIVGALLMVFMGSAVPYIAAYRDSPAMKSKSHSDVIGRLTSLVQGVERDRVGYRYMALGREIYACSDGFILEAAASERVEIKSQGFGDLSWKTIVRIVLPRWISDDKSFEKGDGANIAKALMGVKNSTWFPCITTPADLFRRGGWNGVIVGGGVMGFVIWCLEAWWIRAGIRQKSIESLMLTVLPVTYIQSGLYGTVREILWQLLWDLPKYIVAIIVLDRMARRVGRLFASKGST